MSKEELEKDYYTDRPTEPYSDDDSPNDWANIAHYAEESLEKAFKQIAELEAQIEKMKCCENCQHHYFDNYDVISCAEEKDITNKKCKFWELSIERR